MKSADIEKELKKLAGPKKPASSQRFFKTGKGQYGEGDKFLGISVLEQRKVAKEFQDLSFVEIKKLLDSEIHEHRFVALEILVFKYEKGDNKQKKQVFDFYLKDIKRINNWDLVDTSAPYIVGNWLLEKDKKILYKLAKSENLWDKRISIVSTQEFIRNNQFEDTLKISEILLKDDHDLIHKACGWMLREVGKRSKPVLERFLKKHLKSMPRTELRYAIERFPEKERKEYLVK